MTWRKCGACIGLAIAGMLLPEAHSLAQTQPPISQSPLAPAPQYRPPTYSPSSPTTALPQAPPQSGAPPAPPSAATSGIPDASPPPPPSLGPAVIPNTWIPQGGATLQVLDKVNAQSATLTIKVGQSGTFGSLKIAVQACDIRPPDQPADAAAYLVVADTHGDAPDFKGWMLKKEPEVNMLENPVYDLRVTGCLQ